MRNIFINLSTLLLCFKINNSAKILGVFPFDSTSHQIVYHAICKELVRRGHELTLLTTHVFNDPEIPSDRYRQIEIKWQDDVNAVDVKVNFKEPVHFDPIFSNLILRNFDDQMARPAVQAMLKNESESFDLLLIESYLPSYFGFAHRYKVPYIGVASLGAILRSHEAVGNPPHPVLHPNIYGRRLTNWSFFDKIFAVYVEIFLRYNIFIAADGNNALVKKYFGEDAPAADKLESNMDMLFINLPHILAGLRPIVPATIFLGGIHLKKKKPLPEKLQEFLDNSKRGVIYISFGSRVLSKHLDPKKMSAFVEAFRESNFDVLWKFEEDLLPDKPKNVFISKWLPQQDLLGHKNIKAFITQGGQQSLDEAISNEVPLICLPFITDQDFNAVKIEHFGIGVRLKIDTLNKEKIKIAIKNVTEEKSYKINIKRLNNLLLDQPMTSMDKAMWWIEYVLRHKGAKHLRSPLADISYIEYFMLDVLAILISFGFVFCFSLYLFNNYFRNCWERKFIKHKKL